MEPEWGSGMYMPSCKQTLWHLQLFLERQDLATVIYMLIQIQIRLPHWTAYEMVQKLQQAQNATTRLPAIESTSCHC